MACAVPRPQSLDLKLEKKCKEYQLPRSDFRQKIKETSGEVHVIEDILQGEELPGLKSLWETKDQSDVNLKAGDTVISAHKFVLVAASNYFHAMFLGDFAEADRKEVQLKDIDVTGLKQILTAIYCGSLEITDQNIQILLDTADKTEVKEVIDACEDFLTGVIQATNCFELLQVSEMYTLPGLNMNIESFILANFPAVTEHGLYAHIQSEALITFISNDDMDLPEIEIFQGVLKWFKVHPSAEKKAVLYDVLKHVRFTYMTSSQIREQVLNEAMITQNPDCVKMIEKSLDFVYMYEEQVYSRPLLEASNQEKPRGKLSVAVILPEPDEDDRKFRQAATPHLFLFGTSNEGIINMRDMNIFESEVNFAVFSMNVLHMGNNLFFFGAKHLDEDRAQAKMVLLRLNVQSGEWTTLAEPPFQALVVSVSIIHKHDIYIFGGATYTQSSGIFQHTFKAGCYRYSIENNAWATIASYPHPVAHPAACSLGDDIYVIGGGGTTADTQEREKVNAYNTTTNEWSEKRSLHHGRSGHRVGCVGGKIYVIGGRNPYRKDIPVCEVYDPEEDRWTLLSSAPVPQPVASFNLQVHEENIIILGGGDEKDVHHSSVQTFNTKTLKWSLYNWKDDQPYVLPTGSIHTLPMLRARMSCLTRSKYTPRPRCEEPKEAYWSEDEEFFHSDSDLDDLEFVDVSDDDQEPNNFDMEEAADPQEPNNIEMEEAD